MIFQGIAEDILDSRDLIEYAEDEDTPQEDPDTVAAINALAEEGIEDWIYGATLIREDCFTEYAQQLADDIGAIDRDANWPINCIDWDGAASQLKQDYTEVEFLGHTYFVR